MQKDKDIFGKDSRIPAGEEPKSKLEVLLSATKERPFRSEEEKEKPFPFLQKMEELDGFVARLMELHAFRQVRAQGVQHYVSNGLKLCILPKMYRNRLVNQRTLQHAVSEAAQVAIHSPCHVVLFALCEVDPQLKERFLRRHNVFVWDIGDILFLCQYDQLLTGQFYGLLPYPAPDLQPTHPIGPSFSILHAPRQSVTERITGHFLIEELRDCAPGHAESQHFEELCGMIVQHLFEPEFLKVAQQHVTRDSMFRMDMICSLKGSAAFWEFVMQYYHTKFVVFEFKNKFMVEQNDVIVTEKYLTDYALRNVAIVISRQGFTDNARRAAEGVLKEHGKLILSIDDRMVEQMIREKESGREPSDFLLDLTEQFLMSISK